MLFYISVMSSVHVDVHGRINSVFVSPYKHIKWNYALCKLTPIANFLIIATILYKMISIHIPISHTTLYDFQNKPRLNISVCVWIVYNGMKYIFGMLVSFKTEWKSPLSQNYIRYRPDMCRIRSIFV